MAHPFSKWKIQRRLHWLSCKIDRNSSEGTNLYWFHLCIVVMLLNTNYRPLKIYYCPPRPGDKWPPEDGNGKRSKQSSSSTTTATQQGMSKNDPPRREKTPKPPGCKKLFCGNLSYNIDDETIVDFFKDCGTLTGLRWLVRQGTEEFRVKLYHISRESLIIQSCFFLFFVHWFDILWCIIMWRALDMYSLQRQRRPTKPWNLMGKNC